MKFLVVTGFLVFVAYASADPSQCYSCDDPSTCNDPVDVTKIDVANCDFIKGPLSKELADDLSVVCVKVSGTDEDGVLATYRSCSLSVLDELPFCDYAIQELTHYTEVTCSTCDTDLCNV